MISMKENSRNCCVCGSSTSKDPTLTLHRFPKPGPKNAQRCELWSKYSFPNDAWSSPKFQDELYTKHKMLCSKHFRNTCFLEKKLFRTAVPDVQYHRFTSNDFYNTKIFSKPEQFQEVYIISQNQNVDWR